MKMTGIQVVAIAVLLVAVAGCTTIPVDQRQQVRDEVNRVAAETIAELVELRKADRICDQRERLGLRIFAQS